MAESARHRHETVADRIHTPLIANQDADAHERIAQNKALGELREIRLIVDRRLQIGSAQAEQSLGAGRHALSGEAS